jgi:hypothetical protein
MCRSAAQLEIALGRRGRGLDRNSCNNGEAIVIDPACADAFHQPFLLIASLCSDGQTGAAGKSKMPPCLPPHMIAASRNGFAFGLRQPRSSA